MRAEAGAGARALRRNGDGGAARNRSGGATDLDRSISTTLLLVFVVGNILGAGIFAIVGEVAGRAGGAIWAPFLLAAILAVFTAGSYVELATKFPAAGGAGLYVDRAFGRPWLTLLTAAAVSTSAITSAATGARAFAGDYLGAFLDLPAAPVAIGFIVVLSIVNFMGIDESLRANVVMTALVLAGLGLVVAVGVGALLDGSADTSRLTSTGGDGAAALAVIGGAALAFFAFVGFEDSVQLAEETARPGRSYPLALLGGLGITMLVYLLVAVAASVVVAPDDLARSTGPLLEVVERGSSIPGEVISGLALLALAKTALLQLVASSRLLYGMARRGLLPRALARVHEGRETPWVAIIAVAVLGSTLAGTGELGGLADTTVMLLLTVFVLVDICALRLKRVEVDHEHVVVPKAVPAIGAVVSAALVVYVGVSSGTDVVVRFALLLAGGLAVYAVERALAPRLDQLDAERLGAERSAAARTTEEP